MLRNCFANKVWMISKIFWDCDLALPWLIINMEPRGIPGFIVKSIMALYCVDYTVSCAYDKNKLDLIMPYCKTINNQLYNADLLNHFDYTLLKCYGCLKEARGQLDDSVFNTSCSSLSKVVLIWALTPMAAAQSGLELTQTGGSIRNRKQRDISCRENLEYPHDNICCLNCPAGETNEDLRSTVYASEMVPYAIPYIVHYL